MKKAMVFICCILSMMLLVADAFADGDGDKEMPASVEAVEAMCSGKYACLTEAQTGEVIASKNSTQPIHMGHLAKLMTVYLTARQIEAGEITLDTEVVASSEANSQGETQIWLDAGEKITVLELLKSITIGNANDACYCLAQALFKNSDDYINVANETAVSLDMKNTHFADVTGIDEASVTTAYDVSILAGELVKYDYLKEYFCKWIDYVRDGKTELVNTNRLVRSYDGIFGMKACYDELSGNTVVAVAKRNGMTLVCVVSGCEDADVRFDDAENLLDYGFSAYEIYTPEIPEKALEKIRITNGAKKKAEVCVAKIYPVLIKKGTASNITAIIDRKKSIASPVNKGDIVGKIRLVDGEGEVFSGDIVINEKVSSMSVGLALKILWLNLLNFG